MVFKLLTDSEVLAGIREKFGFSWFTALMARAPKQTLLKLVKQGYLESVKEPYSHTVNFRLKKEDE